MLNRSLWTAIGGAVFAGAVLAAVPWAQRAKASVPAVAAEPAATPLRPLPAASLTLAPVGADDRVGAACA